MSKKRFRPCFCLILQQSCCLCSKSCCWIIGSCRYFSKVVSELSVFLTSWILARGDPFLKVHFQFGAEPQITSGWQFPSQEGQRAGREYPQVERNREAPRGGGGRFRENTVVISGGGVSWQFSRPLINYGEHDRGRKWGDWYITHFPSANLYSYFFLPDAQSAREQAAHLFLLIQRH